MSTLFMVTCMNRGSQSQGLEQGAGLFVMADSAMGSGFYGAAPSMFSPMLSYKTDPEKVPLNCGRI